MELLSAARSSGRKSEGGSEREMAAMEGELRARHTGCPGPGRLEAALTAE